MDKLTVICYQCKEPMALQDTNYAYSHPIENEHGWKECEYYSRQYQCCNKHVAYAWYVHNEPYGDDFYPVFDGQIDYIDSKGEVVFSENVFEE